jgi:hypothetical protein
MRALTVQQPWAWAIVHGGKDVENRTQAWGYRGPLAIHAGARISERGLQSPLVQEAAQRVDSERPVVLPFNGKVWRHDSLQLGAVIGVVDLVDVHTADWCWEPEGHCSPWAESSYVEHGGDVRDRIVHLVLENPRPLATPIPARGRLGLWTPDAELLDRIREQVPE